MAGSAVLRAVAADASAKAKAAMPKALRQTNNENSAKYFAVGMSGMIFLFILLHWARIIFRRYGRRGTGISGLFNIARGIARYPNLILRRS